MKIYTKEEIKSLIKKAEHETWKITNEMNSLAFDKGEKSLSYQDMFKLFTERLLDKLED